MNSQTIEIIISPSGETTVQTKGFSGTSCREASKFIERALGSVQTDIPTSEMYQSEKAQEKIVQT